MRGVAVVFALLLCLALASVGSAATITVSTTAELRAACASAQSGDIIELTDGTYTWSDSASLVVLTDKTNLTIRSQSGVAESLQRAEAEAGVGQSRLHTSRHIDHQRVVAAG